MSLSMYACFSEMGRRRGWFSTVKKALGSQHKERGNQRSRKSNKKSFGKQKDNGDPVRVSVQNDPTALSKHIVEEEPDMTVTRPAEEVVVDAPWSIFEEPYAPLLVEEVQLTEAESSDEKNQAYNVAVAEPLVAEAAEVSPQPAVEVVRLPNLTSIYGKSKENVAAIKIQTAFRGHMARRAMMRASRGLVRLKSLVQGSCIKRQTTSTLQCMQTLARVQSQIRARRIRMSEENKALQRQLQQKHEKEMEKMKLTIGEDWNDSTKSKEKLEASLRHRQEAALRRERALAYAHAQQQKWRNASKTPNPTIMDPVNPHWGWSWLDRWMAARPWESSGTAEDSSGRSSVIRPLSVAEISKAYYAHRELHPDNSNMPLPIPQRPPTHGISSRISIRRSPSIPSPKAPSMTASISKSSSSNGRRGEESRSIGRSVLSRRHSIASSSVIHNASSSEAHRVTTSRPQNSSDKTKGKVEIGSLAFGFVKRRLSYSPVSAARRHSGPPPV
uniref:Uncharacterized protein n=2 Tax=Kalanchoe fedtschenkoi TaxID=63787 RepID=A0A7N0V3U9_KALFE